MMVTFCNESAEHMHVEPWGWDPYGPQINKCSVTPLIFVVHLNYQHVFSGQILIISKQEDYDI